MTFEFLIACCPSGTNIKQILTDLLTDLLTEALRSNSNEFDDGVIADMIQPLLRYSGNEVIDNGDMTSSYMLFGFALELPDEIDRAKDVVDDFTASLLGPDTSPIYHVVKFEDPLLKKDLAERAAEIFDIEMKLRRVLSIIYLNAYQDDEPFNLLRDEKVKFTRQTEPEQAQMKKATENQFFHLNFSQYRDLNQRSSLKLEDIEKVIKNAERYDDFRYEICRIPVEDEVAADLLADLKEHIKPIENMRNCVAHNRRPTKNVADSYPNARQTLDERLDQYLTKLYEDS